MKLFIFWAAFGLFVIFFITQMITVIPILKKEISDEEKLKRQPKVFMLNSLMMIFASIMLMTGSEHTAFFVCGIIFFAIGFINLIVSVIKNHAKK